jgi:hypothetical protein
VSWQKIDPEKDTGNRVRQVNIPKNQVIKIGNTNNINFFTVYVGKSNHSNVVPSCFFFHGLVFVGKSQHKRRNWI